MTLLLDPALLAGRRAIVAGPLAPLARSLGADLRAAIARVAPDGEPWVPAEKARMTRRGGRCPRDGALLAFDPFAPRAHACPACGATYDDDAHHRWWIVWYQLWLAERAVHAAVLHLLTDDPPLAAFARRVLAAYADRYLAYPNVDNVLGPTRPFFSTYLESIWLLQLCVALDALEAADGRDTLGGRVRDRVIAPSAALVAGFDEGGSNRQVWNGAALLAAARLLGDDATADRAVHGPSGLVAQLSTALLADGTWYEGENYHQFAHRGLWYAVTLAGRAGMALPAALIRRFDAGFAAPFLTALPDLTLPSRRDSQYAISLRQWRWAESCELGLARADDERLAATLARLYEPDAAPRGDTGRWRSAAESERNEPPSHLTRADLGWRSLLHARAALPAAGRWAPGSVVLPAQGIAVLRRDAGRLYAALDYGNGGGAHGHPDRLNVLLVDGARRWLDDPGTGSYVERTLHWYRSTLAHCAPLVDGRSQARVDGRLLAYEARGDVGWARAEAAIAPGVVAWRAVVLGDHLVDVVAWDADREVTVDLPVHVDATVPGAAWAPASAPGAGGLEDGFDFLADVEAAPMPRAATLVVDGRPVAWADTGVPATWLRATAPGPPGQGARRFVVARVRAPRGRLVVVWDVRGGTVRDAAVAGDGIVVRRADGGEDRHRLVDGRWHVRRARPGAPGERVVLGSTAPEERPRRPPPPEPPALDVRLVAGARPVGLSLGEPHYRRSEASWREAGRPTARVRLAVRDGRIAVRVAAAVGAPRLVPAGAENALDNERPEVNGDGVQLHLRPGSDPDGPALAWLLVPDPASRAVRVVPTTPAAAAVPVAARWRRTGAGYALAAELPLSAVAAPGAPFLLDVLVNDVARDRERRRGQLVLSGAAGEFVYLRGDRHAPRVAVTVESR